MAHYTQAELDTLDAEIATVRLIKNRTHGDRSTTFRDLNELLELRALMARDIQGGGGSRVAAFNKGV